MSILSIAALVYALKVAMAKSSEQVLTELCQDVSKSNQLFEGGLQKQFESSRTMLGAGSFGSVRSIKMVQSPDLPNSPASSAVKYIPYQETLDKEVQLALLRNELTFLKLIKDKKSSSLMQFYGCYFNRRPKSKGPDFYVLMESLGPTLWSRKKEATTDATTAMLKRQPSERLRIYQSLAKQLNTIHKFGYVHNDIKPDNFVFTDEKGSGAKIVDFGAIYWPRQSMPVHTTFFLSYEAAKNGLGTRGNDAFAFGLSLALVEFGAKTVAENLERNDNWFGITFDPVYWQKLNLQRNVRAAAKKVPWMNKSKSYNFSDLLDQLLTVYQKDRLIELGTVTDWLGALADFHACKDCKGLSQDFTRRVKGAVKAVKKII